MNIDKSSLHYRLFSEYGSGYEHRADLCYYVRRCLMGVLVMVLITMVCVVFSMLILEPFAVLAMWLHTGLFTPGYFIPGAGLILSGSVYFIAFLILLGAAFKEALWWYRTKVWNRELDVSSEPRDATSFDVLGAWLKSKHDKVCLMIKFVDNDKNG